MQRLKKYIDYKKNYKDNILLLIKLEVIAEYQKSSEDEFINVIEEKRGGISLKVTTDKNRIFMPKSLQEELVE